MSKTNPFTLGDLHSSVGGAGRWPLSQTSAFCKRSENEKWSGQTAGDTGIELHF